MVAEAARVVEGEAQGGGGGSMLGSIARALAVYWVISRLMAGGRAGWGVAPGKRARPASGHDAPFLLSPPHANAWRRQTLYELRVYVSEAEAFDAFDQPPLWMQKGLIYPAAATQPAARSGSVSVPASAAVRRNASSLWAHVYASVAGSSPDPSAPNYRPLAVAQAHHPLVRYVARSRVRATKHLLSGEFKDNVSEIRHNRRFI